jgi:hypothetical protein
MTVAEFIKSLVTKSGVQVDDQLTALLNNDNLVNVDIPEALASSIDNKLISLQDAKNNHPEIKNWYQKQALDTVDTSLVSMMEDFGMDEPLRNEILQERSTYKRIPMLVKKVRDLEAKKHTATSTSDKTALQKQIDDLQAQLRTRTAEQQALKSEFDNKVKDYQKQYKLDQLLGQYQTIYDNPQSPLDPEVKTLTLKNLVSKALQENNATFDFDQNGQFILIKNDGGNYYGDNNQLVSPQQFAESVLSRNKLLIVTQPGNGAGANTKTVSNQQSNQGQQQQPGGGQGGGAKGSNTLTALVQESIKNLNDSGKVAIM